MGIINSKKPNTLFRCLQQLLPVGYIHITSNGIHNVRNYEYADVNVSGGITPTGTISITNNGNYDVTQYANADVNVSGGITPTGTLNITSNGNYDVTTYANANVNVSGGALNNTITGTFTYAGENPVVIDCGGFKNGLYYPSFIFIYDTDPTSVTPVGDNARNRYQFLTQITQSNLFKNVFSPNRACTGYLPYFNPSNDVQFTTSTTTIQVMTSGNDIQIPVSATSTFKNGHTYNYIIFVDVVEYDFSNATLYKTQTTYNVDEEYSDGGIYIDNVGIRLNGTLLTNSYHRLSLSRLSDNVIIDSTAVDTSTAGTYTVYVSLDWNAYFSGTITITVV